jgi:TetR/AcrR family transcriptional repressor of lmrAB and yxaGH operons
MTTARDQIIETTCNLLELQGYYATGLNQIIKESGSPKGSLYYYFPGGKEELAVEAVRAAGEVVRQRIRHSLEQESDPAAAVHTFLVTVAHYVEGSGFRTGGPITAIAMETAAQSDRLRETCSQIYEAWRLEFQRKLQSSGINAERARRLAVTILAAIEGATILCRTHRSRVPLEDAAEEIAALVRDAWKQGHQTV